MAQYKERMVAYMIYYVKLQILQILVMLCHSPFIYKIDDIIVVITLSLCLSQIPHKPNLFPTKCNVGDNGIWMSDL